MTAYGRLPDHEYPRKVLKAGSRVEIDMKVKEAQEAGWVLISDIKAIGHYGSYFQALMEYRKYARKKAAK